MEGPHLAYSCIRIEGIVAIPTCLETLQEDWPTGVSQHGGMMPQTFEHLEVPAQVPSKAKYVDDNAQHIFDPILMLP